MMCEIYNIMFRGLPEKWTYSSKKVEREKPFVKKNLGEKDGTRRVRVVKKRKTRPIFRTLSPKVGTHIPTPFALVTPSVWFQTTLVCFCRVFPQYDCS